MFSRLWHSATLMTWLSMLSKSMLVLLLLPMILNILSPGDITVWYLFISVFTLQMLADLGFSSTFVRVLSYAKGGADTSSLGMFSTIDEKKIAGGPNWGAIESIFQNMQHIYNRICLLSILLLGGFTLLLIKPIALSSSPDDSWMAWWIVCFGFLIFLRGNVFSSYVQGMNYIALYRRWDAITGFIGVICSAAVLYYTESLLWLVVSYQFWLIISVPRNWLIARYIDHKKFRSFDHSSSFSQEVFSAVWGSAWKSAIGILMSAGLVHLSGFFYAQLGDSIKVAGYLMAMNLAMQIGSFSQAPFYSKIPTFARLRIQNKLPELIHLSKRSMLMTYWIYIAGVIFIGLFGNWILEYIGSNIAFVSEDLWSLIVLGILFERFGALHIQLYSTTNHIVWHIANGVTGVIYILTILLFYRKMGVYAFPLASIISNLSFYSWYSSSKSYASIKSSFFKFDKTVFLPPALILIFYVSFSIFW